MRAQLMRRALARHPADVLHATCEMVALALELLEAEQPRPAGGLELGHASCVDGDVWKRSRDDLRELALEARHLLAQRTTGRRLVGRLLRRQGRDTAVERQLLNRGAHAASSS
jgi:hypothetical protein